MSSLLQLSEELEALVARVSPSVVGIEQGRGQGTGVVIAQDGYLLTNNHVVGTGKDLRVRFSDGESVRGERVGGDPHTDLAVIRARGEKLSALTLAEPKAPTVGQLVVAIGNPFRFERSVSLGHHERAGPKSPRAGRASVRRAGADRRRHQPRELRWAAGERAGEVVGINTAVIPYAQGMGFAVNARTATWVAALLIQRGEIRRRFLGVGARSVVLPSPSLR